MWVLLSANLIFHIANAFATHIIFIIVVGSIV